MSIDERQIREAFNARLDELAVTDEHVERRCEDMHRRMRQQPKRPRVRAAAAAIVVLATLLGGVAWAQRTEPPPAPATNVPHAEGDVGVWKGTDAAFPFVMVLRADGTVQAYSLSNGLLSRSSVSGSGYVPADAGAGRHRVIGDALELTNVVDPSRDDCSRGFVGYWVAAGKVRLMQVSSTGTGCGSDPPLPSFTMIRVSPASPASLTYSAAATSPISPVLSTNPLAGTWLLRGTGVILAVGWTLPPAGVQYSIDHQGTIDTAPDAQGLMTVPSPGRIVLTSQSPSACADTIMAAASVGDYALTAHVEADPCHRFGGNTVLTWTRLQ